MMMNNWTAALIFVCLLSAGETWKPVFPPTNLAGEFQISSHLEELLDLGGEGLVSLVPPGSCVQQVNCPKCSLTDRWSWTVKKPDELRCEACGWKYPSEEFPTVTDRLENIGGSISIVEYVLSSNRKQRIPVQGRLFAMKMQYLEKALPALGEAYLRTGDERFARLAILVLDRYGSVLDDYVFLRSVTGGSRYVSYPFWKTQVGTRNTYAMYGGFSWNAFENPRALVSGFDWVCHSKSWALLSSEKGYDIRTHVIKNTFGSLLRPILEIDLNEQLKGNLAGPFVSTAMLASILQRDDLARGMVQYLEAFLNAHFTADGFFPESFAYHDDLVNTLLAVCEALKVWSARTREQEQVPVDAVGIAMRIERASSRLEAARAAGRSVVLPDGSFPPVHDTWPNNRRVSPLVQSRCAFLQGFGQFRLGDGDGDQQVQAQVHFSGGYNHSHHDTLSLIFWAMGAERFSDIGYSRVRARFWNICTPSHNLVVIDRAEQNHQDGKNAVETSGDLLWQVTNSRGVSAVCIDGTRAYSPRATVYRRLVLLKTMGPSRSYLLDAFAVQGGDIHDYILHGSSDLTQQARSSLPLAALAGERPLLEVDEKWVEPGHMYDIFATYGMFRNVRHAVSTESWQVSFVDVETPSRGVRSFLLQDPSKASQYILAENPSQRCANIKGGSDWRKQYDCFRPNLMVRRKGPINLFISVSEAYDTRHAVSSRGDLRSSVSVQPGSIARVEMLDLGTTAQDGLASALKIHFTDGRLDTILMDLGRRVTPRQTRDGQYRLEGHLGVESRTPQGVRGWLVGGDRLQTPMMKMAPLRLTHEGSVAASHRDEEEERFGFTLKPDDLSAFAEAGTFTDFQLTLECGAHSNGMTGFTFTFPISEMKMTRDSVAVRVPRDHGLSVNPEGTKEIRFPHRNFVGPTRFKISRWVTEGN